MIGQRVMQVALFWQYLHWTLCKLVNWYKYVDVDVDFNNNPNFVERDDTDLDQDYVDVGFHGQEVLYDLDQENDIFNQHEQGDFG